MKNSHKKHKGMNTFVFKSFADRLEEIDVRRLSIYYIGHSNEELLQSDETYFSQTLQKWMVLNISREFVQFQKKCQHVKTLSQLLHEKDKLIALLLDTLSTATTLSMQPVLELVAVLSRDLREDFYPHFKDVLQKLINMLQTSEVEHIEWIFTCLAFLFKSMKPFLRRNIPLFFNIIFPLLDDSVYSENITNFAAECFAFIIRETKDAETLLNVILESVDEHKNAVAGCGRLFFDIMKGVNGDFNSNAEKFMELVLSRMARSERHQFIIFEILMEIIRSMLNFIHPPNMGTFCKVLYKSMEENTDATETLGRLLEVIQLIISHKNGGYVQNVEQLATVLIKCKDSNEEAAILKHIVSTAVRLLLSKNTKLTQMDTSRLTRKFLDVSSADIFEYFVWRIRDHAQFDVLVWPQFLKYFENNICEQSLDMMARIMLHKTQQNEGQQATAYRINFRNINSINKIEENIVNSIKYSTLNETSLLNILVYGYLNIKKPEIDDVIEKILEKLTNDLEKNQNSPLKTIFSINVCLKAMQLLKNNLPDVIAKSIIETVLPFCSTDNKAFALQTVDLLLANVSKESFLTAEIFLRIESEISNNLSSWSHEIRLKTCKILNRFNHLKETKTATLNVYQIFFDIESIVTTVHNFKDQIMLFQKISADVLTFNDLPLPEMRRDCLRFVLGYLHNNFKLLWNPLLNLISSYSRVLDTNEFWNIFKSRIDYSLEAIKCPEKNTNKRNEEFKSASLNEMFSYMTESKQNINFYHYRELLWRALSQLGPVCEIKNKEIVKYFLDFVCNEYTRSEESNLDDDFDENEDNITVEDKSKRKKVKRNMDCKSMETLKIKLSVFTKMANPKQLYREPELKSFYLKLLSSSNQDLQKLALDCILGYKSKSLMPYKDHLNNLIDENKMKDELINLKIDAESKIIQAEHRSEIIPILLRILFGKMLTKGSSKNLSSQVRKSIVIRFLTGCEKREIFWFIKTIFSSFEEIMKEDLNDIVPRINGENIEGMWTPQKLQSAINLLDIVKKEFGGLLGQDFQNYCLKIIVLVGAVCAKLVAKSVRKEHVKVSSTLKSLKCKITLTLVDFYEMFIEYNWTEPETNRIFEIFVFPYLEKFPYECIHSPTPLLKLFSVWSENSEYFVLLNRSDPLKPHVTPMRYIIELYQSVKAKPIIYNTITSIIEKLVIEDGSAQQNEDSGDNPLTGSHIVAPYISSILNRFKTICSTKSKRIGLQKKELLILSQITALVSDKEDCDTLLVLLLPILHRQSKSSANEDDTIIKIIKTLGNLLKRVAKPEKHLREIAPLFEEVTPIPARKQLCALISDLAKCLSKDDGGADLKQTAQILNGLNSWDKRWIEQPDFDKRLQSIRIIKEKLIENEIDLDLGVLTIYNCFYFLRHVKDIGLRDNSIELLKILIPQLINNVCKSPHDLHYLIDVVLLNLIRSNLRCNDDSIRNECIQLLGVMARECYMLHPILFDLNTLSSKNDPEVDFFENLTHLQSHRHGRALLKFSSVIKSAKKPWTCKTLTSIILPLATRYLLSEKYSSKHTLVDAAIEAIGAVCQHLPWHQYNSILKFYLQKMKYNLEYQKQLVRIVVTILDSFHFDLTKAEEKISAKGIAAAVADEIQCIDKNEISQISTEENDDVEIPISTEKDFEKLDTELDQQETVDSAKSEITILSSSAAKRVVSEISKILIPTLNNSIVQLTKYQSKHKVNRRKRSAEREEEEIMRVPLALAIVKLLQKLPVEILERSLPGVFNNVCTFLKSPLKSVRMRARDILQSIMRSLGSKYLALLINQLSALLTRGFQVHVLSVTLHGVLDCLKDSFAFGDVDKCLQNILDITLNDIFGDPSDEKGVTKMFSHTPESKTSSKSFLSLYIAAKNIQEVCFIDLLLPFRTHLARTQSKKILGKVQDCFQRITQGLSENKNVSHEAQLMIIYGVISESIPDLLPGTPKPTLTEKEKVIIRKTRPDCLLIPAVPPRRSGAITKSVKINAQANAHVLIEFGLGLLLILLKRKHIMGIDYEPFLNPMVPILRDSLKSTHLKVVNLSLKCLASIWNDSYQLEQMKCQIEEIVGLMFEILHRYFSADVSKTGENYNLVRGAFKATVALLRHCEYHRVDDKQLSQLLFYVEQDLHDFDRQPIAFSLLKAIVSRKFVVPMIHDIMKKLSELTVVTESEFAKTESRAILLKYMQHYPAHQKIESILKFFSMQLNFETSSGRLSASKFLHMAIKQLPIGILQKQNEFLFLSLGTRFVNEPTPECRIEIANCVEKLLDRINVEQRNRLFELTLLFLENDKPAIKEMAATLCSRFVVLEKENFSSRCKLVLPLLMENISRRNQKSSGKFVRISHDTNSDRENSNSDPVKQRAMDHQLIQTQNCIIKIFEKCSNILENKDFDAYIDQFAYESQRCLGHEHEWVRLNAIKLFQFILAAIDCTVVESVLLHRKPNVTDKHFIYSNPGAEIKSLTLDLCAQLLPGQVDEEKAENVIKLLLFIANMLKSVVIDVNHQNINEPAPKISLNWLIRRLRFIANKEVSKAPMTHVLRSAVFKWVDGILVLVDQAAIRILAPDLLSLLTRELTDAEMNSNTKLKHQAVSLGKKIRNIIGEEAYDKLRVQQQTKLLLQRAERKRKIAQEKINDPIRAAKRKQYIQVKKKILKKRKIDETKGISQIRKKRKMSNDEESFF